VFLIVDDDADDQSVISFRIDLLTFEIERLNFADDADDAVRCVQARLAFNDGSQVFFDESSLHERKSLITVLTSENENRSPFSEEVVEVHGVRCKLSLLLKSKNEIRILNRVTSEVKKDLISSGIMKGLMRPPTRLSVSICPLPWGLVVDCRLDVSAYLPPREMRSKLPDFTELL